MFSAIQVNRIYLIFNPVHFSWTVVFSDLIYNFIETLPGLDTRTVLTDDLAMAFHEDVDMEPTIVNNSISSITCGIFRDKLQIHSRHIIIISVL